MPLVRAGEIELSYERSGSGPPLLMIMGMSGTTLHWGEPFLDALRADFELITYDHRGIGASSRVYRPFTIAQLARDAEQLMRALKLDSAHVFGISMGGMIAQELALNWPARVRSLVLGCSYCGGRGSSLATTEVLRQLSDAMMSGDRERALRSAWSVNVCDTLLHDESAFETFRAIGLQRPVAVPVVMAQMQAIAGHETSERLAQLTIPTLIVHGTLDELVPVDNARLIAELIPGARVEIMDGVGHLFFWEQPQRSAELVRAHALVQV
ncbi:MAG TPA: alpha/beta fold hydrolase [Solirubrobacteraceae bacterium]|nr:alpha/beta fold hydrolase [Solirubrobacteraceae bacterium]